ncbi:MAG: glycosyl transferase [Cyclobacteriaceae bacterium]|nr:glycosyl transferase [Cyclobacteriaceae bacterium]
MKKLLIITYYWPPSGGSGVQRWLKFVKYLPSFGWQPFVFTPDKPSFEISDATLLKDVPKEAEVIHFPIWEPYGLFKSISKIAGRKSVSQIDMISSGKKSMFQRISSWIRGNVFIPDARIFWVSPSVKFLQDIIHSNNITTIITTGPPHSLHLIGLKLKKKNPSLHWVADFRDPWSEWDLLDTLSLSSFARRRHCELEREVLQTADRVVTIAPFHVDRLEVLGKRKVDLITNGFDEDDFAGIQKNATNIFTVRHIGMVDELRDPKPFMLAVKNLSIQSNEFSKNVKIEFIGSVNTAFREFVAADPFLSEITLFSKPMPHEALVKLYGETDIQLLILAHTALAAGNLPGKFFEYLASGNFIFGVGPEIGDAATILQSTQAGRMIDRNNATAIKALLLERFECWKNGSTEDRRNVRLFSRKVLTEKMVSLLK